MKGRDPLLIENRQLGLRISSLVEEVLSSKVMQYRRITYEPLEKLIFTVFGEGLLMSV